MTKQFCLNMLLMAGLAGMARGQGPAERGSAPAFDPHDISGFWELSFDSRNVPPAQLADA